MAKRKKRKEMKGSLMEREGEIFSSNFITNSSFWVKWGRGPRFRFRLDSTAISIFVVILVELTNTVFANSTNITTNIETAALSN